MFCFENIKDKTKENFRKISLIVFSVYIIIYIAEYIHSNKVLHFLNYQFFSYFFICLIY